MKPAPTPTRNEELLQNSKTLLGFVIDKDLTSSTINSEFHNSCDELIAFLPSQFFNEVPRNCERVVQFLPFFINLTGHELYSLDTHNKSPRILAHPSLKTLILVYDRKVYKYSRIF